MAQITRRVLVAAVLVLLTITGAEAQTEVQYILTPSLGDGTYLNPYRPKYVAALPRLLTLKYGWENAFLVALELTPEQQASLSAQPDVVLFSKPLDEPISALALTTLVSRLEAANIPARYLTTARTWRDALRGVRKPIRFMQRMQELSLERLFDTATLDTRLNQLTVAQRQRLSNAADDLGLDRSQVTNTMTVYEVLVRLAPQLPDLTVAGEAF